MENCKHERCEWVAEKKHWYFRIPAAFGTSINGVTHCPDCGAKLTPHEPPVMTLEEVQADMMKWARVFGRDKLDRDKGILDTWHRSITAHLEKEPQGLTAGERRAMATAINTLRERLGPDAHSNALGELSAILERHTKGEKHDDPSGWRSKP
jgi:hypothetical protein